MLTTAARFLGLLESDPSIVQGFVHVRGKFDFRTIKLNENHRRREKKNTKIHVQLSPELHSPKPAVRFASVRDGARRIFGLHPK